MAIERVEIDARGLRFDALAAGPERGELVLLLHGFPQTAECWRDWLPALADAGFRAVAPNQRGYSRGAMPREVSAYRIAECAADVVAMAERLGGRRCHVIGHDWGGAAAWEAARSAPARFASLTAVSTPHPSAIAEALRHTEQRARFAYMLVLRVPKLAEAFFTLADGALAVQAVTATGLPATRARRDVSALRALGVTGALNWYRAIDARATVRTPSRRAPVRVPSLFIWGDRDPAFGREAAEATERHVAAPYHFVELSGAGHWIPDLHWNDVSDLVLEHLRAHRARTRGGA